MRSGPIIETQHYQVASKSFLSGLNDWRIFFVLGCLSLLYVFRPLEAILLFTFLSFLVAIAAKRWILALLCWAVLMRPATNAGLPIQDGWWLIGALLAGLTYSLAAGRRIPLKLDWLLIILLVWMLITSTIAILAGYGHVNRHLAMIALGLFVILFVSQFAGGAFRPLFEFDIRLHFLLIGVGLVLFTLIVALSQHGLFLGYSGFLSLRFVETTTRNLVGIAGALLVAAYLFPGRESRIFGGRWFLELMLAMSLLVGILAAGQRVIIIAILGAIALVALAAFFVSIAKRGMLMPSSLVAPVFIITLFLAFVYIEYLVPGTRLARDLEIEDNIRLYYWDTILNSMETWMFWFGAGIGFDTRMIDAYSHSFFFAILLSLGIPGLTIFGLLFVRDISRSAGRTASQAQLGLLFYAVIAYSVAGDIDWPDFYAIYLISRFVEPPRYRIYG